MMDNEWGPFNKKLYHTTIKQKTRLFCRRTQWICSVRQTAAQCRTKLYITLWTCWRKKSLYLLIVICVWECVCVCVCVCVWWKHTVVQIFEMTTRGEQSWRSKALWMPGRNNIPNIAHLWISLRRIEIVWEEENFNPKELADATKRIMEINNNDIASVWGWFHKVSEICRATLQVTDYCSNALSRFLILCPSCHSRKSKIH